jgi:hypothetical protein
VEDLNMPFTLYQPVAALAASAHPFTSVDLDQPYRWRSQDEGLRFALLGSHFELQELAARLARQRAAAGPGLSWTQRILGQYHAAYRDLQAVLIGLDPALYDVEPAPAEWPLRYVLGHMANAQRAFLTLVDYGWRMQHDPGLPLRIPSEEKARKTISDEAFEELFYRQGLAEMLAFFDDLHAQIMRELVDLPEELLEKPGPVWWEGEPYPLHYRLQRMEAHLIQHTIQAENTRAAVAGPDFAGTIEARQLVRHLYRALAQVEAAVLGAPELGLAERETLAGQLLARTAGMNQALDKARAMQAAVAAGDAAAVEATAAANPAVVNALAANGRPLLLEAAFLDRPAVIEALLATGAEVDILSAASLGLLDRVQAAYEAWPGWLDEVNREGMTPLHLAAYFGRIEVVAWLLEEGADPDRTDAAGHTPMTLAEARNQPAVVGLMQQY